MSRWTTARTPGRSCRRSDGGPHRGRWPLVVSEVRRSLAPAAAHGFRHLRPVPVVFHFIGAGLGIGQHTCRPAGGWSAACPTRNPGTAGPALRHPWCDSARSTSVSMSFSAALAVCIPAAGTGPPPPGRTPGARDQYDKQSGISQTSFSLTVPSLDNVPGGPMARLRNFYIPRSDRHDQILSSF